MLKYLSPDPPACCQFSGLKSSQDVSPGLLCPHRAESAGIMKSCHMFQRGKCWRGSECRYLHSGGADSFSGNRGSDRPSPPQSASFAGNWNAASEDPHKVMLATAALLKGDIAAAMRGKSDDERKKLRRQLQLLWHPDKHIGKPNMSLLATYVTVMLNEDKWTGIL